MQEGVTMVEISTESFKRADLITVSGRIDSSNASELDSALSDVTDNGRHNIVLDLSGIDYMSSAGLRAIVGSYRECRSHGGDVRIANPSERMAEVFDLAGLTAIFTIYDDSTAAVGSF
jgi:anti-sigma B factor antagonist